MGDLVLLPDFFPFCI